MARFRALPYAKALYEVVRDQEPDRIETVADELDRIAETLGEIPEFGRVLVVPTVPVEVKTRVLTSVLEALEIGPPTRRFVDVVQRHYRMQHLADIADAYRELVDRSLGRTRAAVETAQDLGDEERRRLTEAVADIEGGTVAAEFIIRPELLGGFRLQVGSRVFDGSLAGELERLSHDIDMEHGQQG